jgi:5'-3' exonuclease
MKIAIIDGNNLAYKAYAQFVESKYGLLKNSMGVPTTIIFSLMRTLSLLANKTSCDKVIICWDIGGGNQWRRNIFPLYKKNRSYKDMNDYFAELESARIYFKASTDLTPPREDHAPEE